MINSRQLEYFRAVARELHFTRAAEGLGVAQPALSQQIRKLERQLGLQLLERDHHRVAVTPAGEALLEHAERVLADLAVVEDEMLGWSAGIRGRFRLGVARGLSARLARVLAGFSTEYPQVDLELREESNEAMVADLYAARLDVATLAAMPWPDAGLLHAVVCHVPASAKEPEHEHADLRYVLATRHPDAITPENEHSPLRWLSLDEARALVGANNIADSLDRLDRQWAKWPS